LKHSALGLALKCAGVSLQDVTPRLKNLSIVKLTYEASSQFEEH